MKLFSNKKNTSVSPPEGRGTKKPGKKLKKIICMAAVVLSLCLSSCGSGRSAPPPDLTGEWKQVGESGNFYQIATITDDTIETYWYVVSDGSLHLYWTGTFTPPENGKGSYTWQSVNDLDKAQTSPWARREETNSFTYKDGKITYVARMGSLNVSVALEKLSPGESFFTPE